MARPLSCRSKLQMQLVYGDEWEMYNTEGTGRRCSRREAADSFTNWHQVFVELWCLLLKLTGNLDRLKLIVSYKASPPDLTIIRSLKRLYIPLLTCSDCTCVKTSATLFLFLWTDVTIKLEANVLETFPFAASPFFLLKVIKLFSSIHAQSFLFLHRDILALFPSLIYSREKRNIFSVKLISTGELWPHTINQTNLIGDRWLNLHFIYTRI